MRLTTVLFDFDGTLANTLPLTIHGMRDVFERYDQQTLSAADVIDRFGPTEDGMIANNFVHQQYVDEAIARYYEIYTQDHIREVAVNPLINKLLKELRARRFKTGVITGKSRRSYEISEQILGFESFFDCVITGNDVTEPKPNPEGILKAMDALHADPQTTIYIGDSNNDILAGKAAGTYTAAVQWLEMAQSADYPANPDFLWHDIHDCIDLIQSQSNE
ncbi:MAG: HAD family hydrolase [Sporolactobacillus sp.]